MEMKMSLCSKKISDIFWVSSAIAIFMVVCAHCAYENYYLQRITSIFGSIGVPIFLIKSGFYLNREESTKNYWLKKLKSIIIPWLIISPFLYLFSIYKNNASFNLIDCCRYCIGYETWLYYIVILLVYYAVFRFLKYDWFIYVSIVLFFVSNILDVYGVNPISNITTPYLNFFNRIGYFAVGIILKKFNLYERLISNRRLSFICCIVVFPLGIPFIWWYIGIVPTVLLIIYRLLFAYSVFTIANRLSDIKWLISVGKDTYLVFFLHMQFGLGLANQLLHRIGIESEYFVFTFRPLLALALVLGGIIVLRKIVRLLKLEKYAWIVGLKADNVYLTKNTVEKL